VTVDFCEGYMTSFCIESDSSEF